MNTLSWWRIHLLRNVSNRANEKALIERKLKEVENDMEEEQSGALDAFILAQGNKQMVEPENMIKENFRRMIVESEYVASAISATVEEICELLLEREK